VFVDRQFLVWKDREKEKGRNPVFALLPFIEKKEVLKKTKKRQKKVKIGM